MRKQRRHSPVSLLAIGGSAGDIEALRRFFSRLHSTDGIAFVMVDLGDPGCNYGLTDLLREIAGMPVLRAENGLVPETRSVYVILPDHYLGVEDGTFRRGSPKKGVMPADHFFRSLAHDRKDRAICVILSGKGPDGSEGAKAVHESGGVVLVREPSESVCPEIPRCIIANGCADFVTTIERLPGEVVAHILNNCAIRTTDGPVGNDRTGSPAPGDATESALREDSERYDLVLAGAGVAIWEWDVPNRRVEYSPQWKAMRGYATDEVSDREDEWSEGIHPDDAPRVMAAVQEHFERKTPFFFEEYRVRRKDGSYIWVADRGLARRDAEGRVVRMAGSETDITARKQVEAELQGTARQRQLALNAARLGWWHYDPVTKIMSWDDRFREIFGVTAHTGLSDEILAQPTHPEDLPALRAKIMEALDPVNPQPFAAEYRIQHPEGSVRWIEAYGIASFEGTDDNRRATSLVGTVADVTERRRTETRLKEIAEKYSTLFNATSDGVWIYNLDGVILEVNDAYCRMSGYTREELTGMPISRLDTMGTPAQIADHITRIAMGGHDRFETRHRRKDGSIFDVDITALYFEKQSGRMAIFVRDISERKKVEEAVRHLALFPEENPNPVLRCAPDGTVAYINVPARRWLGILGWRAGAPLPSPVLAAVNKARGQDHAVESEICDPAGNTFTVFAVQPPGEDYINLYCIDITERKQAEEILRQSRMDLDRAQEVGQTGSWRLDIHRNVLTWSDHNHRIFGVPKGTPLTYETFLGIVHPDDRLQVDTEWKAAMTGEPYDIEHRIVVGDQVKWVREKAYPEFDGAGTLLGGFGISQDITARKQAEEAAAESEGRLRALMDHVPTPIQGYRTDGIVTYWNRASELLYGYSSEEAVGKNLGDLVIPPAVQPLYQNALETSKTLTESGEFLPAGEVELRRKDGTSVLVYSTHTAVCRPGKPPMLFCLDLDLTERRHAEDVLRRSHEELELRVRQRTQELQQAYERLLEETKEKRRLEEQLHQSQKLEAVGTLAGGIAHDFNNILAAILGNTELALDDVDKDNPARHNLNQILKATHRARDLITEILAFTRKSGKEQRPIRLTPLVRETYSLLRASLPATVAMQLRLSTANDTVVANPSQIQQVVMNLATNAAQAMPDGGHLEIALVDARFDSLQALPDPDLRPGEFIELSVRDTGCGMGRELLERIFEPFFTTKTAAKGTGLGLSVAYGIVKSCQGAISVASEPGKGSTFTVFLPKSDEGGGGLRVVRTAVPRGTEKILFVDDEEELRIATEGILSRLGYRVTSEGDPRRALRLFQDDPRAFDVIITDHTMPGMTGLTLSREILKIRGDAPIILCTGYSEEVDEERARAAGIREFLMKPLTKQELAEAVVRILGQETENNNSTGR